MGVVQHNFFLPSAGDEYEHHPSIHRSIALPMREVPKMSVGAICFTSFGSNGGCPVVFVIFLINIFFSEKKMFVFLYKTNTPPPKKNSARDLWRKKIWSKKRMPLAPKKKMHVTYGKKRCRLRLFSAIDLCFPRSQVPSNTRTTAFEPMKLI